jgi:hypothetical protein
MSKAAAPDTEAILRKIRDQYTHGLGSFKKVLLVDENALEPSACASPSASAATSAA